MAKGKHTPGPWSSCDPRNFTKEERAALPREMRRCVTVDANANCIFRHEAQWLPTKADLRLIVAAPDLLEALQDAVLLAGPFFPDIALDGYRAVIAKATGEPNNG